MRRLGKAIQTTSCESARNALTEQMTAYSGTGEVELNEDHDGLHQHKKPEQITQNPKCIFPLLPKLFRKLPKLPCPSGSVEVFSAAYF